MSHLPPLKGESLRIIFIIILGWSSFALADTTSKSLTQDFEPSFIILFNVILSIPLLCAWIYFQKGWKGFLSPKWKWLIARGTCIGFTAFGVVNAFAHIPLADAYGITFSAPFIAVCLAFLILKEQVGLHRWLSVIIGFIGVLILVGPKFETMNIGILYAGVAALAIALGTIIIRKIGKNEYLPLFILYPFIGMLCVNLPLAYDQIEIPDMQYLGWFIANTVFVFMGIMCTTYGIAHAKATATVAPFVYTQIIWGVVFGYFIFDDIPTLTTTIGLALVVGAGIYMILRESQLNKNKR